MTIARLHRAGSFALSTCSLTTLTALTAAALLPSTALAQFSGITQRGGATALSTVTDSSPQGRYVNNYGTPALLVNQPSGLQTLSSSGSTGTSATLSTLVSPTEISVNGYTQATSGTQNFYSSAGVLNHVTATSSSSNANATIGFQLIQPITLSVTDSYGNSGSLQTFSLSHLNSDGTVSETWSGRNLLGLTALDTGLYSLSISSIGGSGALSWGVRLHGAAVPEPGTLSLWALGGLLLAGAVRRTRG